MTTLDITLSQEDWVRLMDLLYELPVSDLNEKIMSQLGVICLHGPVANVCPHCSSMNVVDDGLLDDVEVILNKDNTESIVTFEFEGDNYFMCFKCFDCGTHFCIDQNMMVSSDCYETC